MNEETPSSTEAPPQSESLPEENLTEFGEFFKKLCQQVHLSLNPDGETKLGFSIAVFDVTSANPTAQIWSNANPTVVYKVLKPWMARMRNAFEKAQRRKGPQLKMLK